MDIEFPFSMENIPQSQSFFCLSLKFGAIVSGLVAILYSVLGLAECGYALTQILSPAGSNDFEGLLDFTIVMVVTMSHTVTLVLSTLLLLGVIKDKPKWIKPWVVWISIQTVTYMLIFVFSSTMSMINHYHDGSLFVYMIDFLVLVIRLYMLIMVASYYKQLVLERVEGFTKIVNRDSYHSTL